MKVKQYHAASSGSVNGLIDVINGCIAYGWEPFGGITYNSKSEFYVQALVRYEEDPIKTEVKERNVVDIYKEGSTNPKSDYELKSEHKERKVVDVLVKNSDFEWSTDMQIEKNKELGFETLSITENPTGSTWKFTLKMVKYEN